MDSQAQRDGEYQIKGDYHRELDSEWRYYPIYIAKTDYLAKYLEGIPESAKILDAGCGEGVLVEKYREMGYNITGLDLNYSSEHVTKGDLLNMPFEDEAFDIVLCLDVIEHLNFQDQVPALREVHRILKEDGTVLLAIPNLAHFASRLSFLLPGSLIRTSTVARHRGDRPIREYLKMLSDADFCITKRRGIFPTLPIISILTYRFPGKVMPIHRILNHVIPYPNWCFLNIIVCKKK